MTKVVIGIDPGLTGAVARVHGDELQVSDMPILEVNRKRTVSAVQLADLLREIRTPGCQVVIERVAARPGQGVVSMFSFGQSYGVVIGVVAALDIPMSFITPQEWRKGMRVAPGGKDASRQRILELKPECSQLFSRKRDHGRADAALIAIYATT